MPQALSSVASIIAAILWVFFDVPFLWSLCWGVIITFAPVILIFVVMLFAGRNDEKLQENSEIEFREQLRLSIPPIVNRHMDTLVRKRRIMLREDEYGLRDVTKWQTEVRNFIKNVLGAQLPVWPNSTVEPQEVDRWNERVTWIANELIEHPVSLEQERQDASFPAQYDPRLTPADYEHFIAARFKSLGWGATVTKASGDQGVDVIAAKGSNVLIVQCKQYSGPVGNKAVQEIAAAVAHYRATHAAVVTTIGYTPAARELAASNGVLLLHHDDLSRIDFLLGRSNEERTNRRKPKIISYP